MWESSERQGVGLEASGRLSPHTHTHSPFPWRCSGRPLLHSLAPPAATQARAQLTVPPHHPRAGKVTEAQRGQCLGHCSCGWDGVPPSLRCIPRPERRSISWDSGGYSHPSVLGPLLPPGSSHPDTGMSHKRRKGASAQVGGGAGLGPSLQCQDRHNCAPPAGVDHAARATVLAQGLGAPSPAPLGVHSLVSLTGAT